MLNGVSFLHTVNTKRLTVFKAFLYDINKSIEAKSYKERPLEEVVQKQCQEFLPLYNNILEDCITPYRLGINHEVRLKKGKPATRSPLYLMSRAELVCLNERLESNMSQGYIGQSSSPFAAHVLFATKRDWGLQFCINYHDIGSQTIYN